MKRKTVLLATLMSLLVILISTFGVAADSGSLPHPGGCVAYCARAIVYEDLDGDGTWEPWDLDEDGKVETCKREFGTEFAGELPCHKAPSGFCPEIDGDGDGVFDRCVLPEDGWGMWCRLMHGKDTH